MMMLIMTIIVIAIETKLRGLSRRANYADRVTATCRRSYCQHLRIEGLHVVSVSDPYNRILGFLDRSCCYSFQVAPQLYLRGFLDTGRCSERPLWITFCLQHSDIIS
jgi:hypothetical protein